MLNHHFIYISIYIYYLFLHHFQINDAEFIQCRGFVMDYLASWGNQRSKLPRLQLVWTVSKRTLNKLKPSTRCILDLEPIMEDEVDEFSDETDAGPFDRCVIWVKVGPSF